MARTLKTHKEESAQKSNPHSSEEFNRVHREQFIKIQHNQAKLRARLEKAKK